jgi:hypothetical protein
MLWAGARKLRRLWEYGFLRSLCPTESRTYNVTMKCVLIF